jgi:hypothetical protein
MFVKKGDFNLKEEGYKLKTPPLLPGKSSAIFTLRFAFLAGLVSPGRIKTGLAPLRFKKANTFLSALCTI